jgi:hypothetical protein
MRVQDASLTLKLLNPCPVCGAETALAEIEPHPLHVNFEIHGYLRLVRPYQILGCASLVEAHRCSLIDTPAFPLSRSRNRWAFYGLILRPRMRPELALPEPKAALATIEQSA